MPDKLKMIQTWTRQGIRVFPLPAGKKIPKVKWKDVATTDPNQIQQWIDAGHDFGAVMGHFENEFGEGYAVAIDQDVKSGPDGIAAFDAMKGGRGWDECTVSQTTSSGGKHTLFDASEPYSNSAVRFPAGIDVRGQGGYVKIYEPISELPILPPWLRSYLVTPTQRVELKVDPQDAERDIAQATEHLKRAQPAIEGQTGDNWTYQIACQMLDYGLSHETCLSLMAEYWNDRCEPPWEIDELERKVRNSWKYRTGDGHEQTAEARDEGYAEVLDEAEALEVTKQAEKKARKERLRADFDGVYANEPAFKDMRPPRWRITNIMPETGIGLLVGPWASFKSFLMMELAFALCHGTQWLGAPIHRAANVAVLSGEGNFDLKTRVEAQVLHQSCDWPNNLRLITRMPDFSVREEFEMFKDRCRAHQTDVLLIDTFARLLPPGMDENSAADVGRMIRWLDELWRETGLFVFCIHHMGKDTKRGSRGSSALPAGVDLILEVEGLELEDEAWLNMTKSKAAPTWKERRGAQGTKIIIGQNMDGDEITSLAFTYRDGLVDPASERAKSTRKLQTLKEIIHDAEFRATYPDGIPTSTVADELAARLGGQAKGHSTWLGDQVRADNINVVQYVRGRGDRKTYLWGPVPLSARTGENDAEAL